MTRGFKIAAGAAFLLLFGIALGVLLSQSVRPRLSEMDTITGDFLTGTGPGGISRGSGMGSDGSARHLLHFLAEGRGAFERQDWPEAIEYFNKVLSIDPNQPEAHSYMGLILVRAGHADGALMAFERALSSNPNSPLALWGKGMVLYKDKDDLPGARQTLERLLTVLPPGDEKNEIQKTIAEIAQLLSSQKEERESSEGELY
jgi:regulator of sirC expression with transglutaminase-like and TPR domain